MPAEVQGMVVPPRAPPLGQPASPVPSSGRRLTGLAVLAFLVTGLVSLVWSILLVANLATSPALPWSAAVAALLLGVLWRVLDGSWGPRRGALERRRLLRARPLPRATWAWSLLAGAFSIVALVGLWIVLIQLSGSTGRGLPDYSAYPPATVALLLITAAVVGAVAEEAMFRGYFQGELERSLGTRGLLAIVITALVMAPEHALTQGFLVTTFLFYLAVDGVLGLTAYLTDSILPGTIVHAVGLMIFFALIWPGDATRVSVSAGGADATFWLHVGQTVVFGALALVAFGRVAGGRGARSTGVLAAAR
jgi:membrane protease YdiL (CAAX protease family)